MNISAHIHNLAIPLNSLKLASAINSNQTHARGRRQDLDRYNSVAPNSSSGSKYLYFVMMMMAWFVLTCTRTFVGCYIGLSRCHR